MSYDSNSEPTIPESNIVDLTGLPASPKAGWIGFDSANRSVLQWYDGVQVEHPSYVGGDDVLTSETTVQNTTSETIVVRNTAQAGGLVKSRNIKQYVFGSYSTASTSDELTVRTYIGSSGFDPTNGEGSQVSSVVDTGKNVTDAPWRTKNTFTIFVDDASGDIRTHTEGIFNSTLEDNVSAGGDTIDTTADEDLVVTLQWNNAKSGNIATVEQGYLQQQA